MPLSLCLYGIHDDIPLAIRGVAVTKGSLIAVAKLYEQENNHSIPFYPTPLWGTCSWAPFSSFASSAFIPAFSMPIYKLVTLIDARNLVGLCGPPISGAIKEPLGNTSSLWELLCGCVESTGCLIFLRFKLACRSCIDPSPALVVCDLMWGVGCYI